MHRLLFNLCDLTLTVVAYIVLSAVLFPCIALSTEKAMRERERELLRFSLDKELVHIMQDNSVAQCIFPPFMSLYSCYIISVSLVIIAR